MNHQPKQFNLLAFVVVIALAVLLVFVGVATARPAENPAYLRMDVARKMAHGYTAPAKSLRLYGTPFARVTRCDYLRRSAIDCRVRLTYEGVPVVYRYDWKAVHVIRTFGDTYAWGIIADWAPYATGLVVG